MKFENSNKIGRNQIGKIVVFDHLTLLLSVQRASFYLPVLGFEKDAKYSQQKYRKLQWGNTQIHFSTTQCVGVFR